MSSYTCPSKLVTEAIVISGMGGRYPESDSTDEFAQNLYNNVDMITEDNRRWPTELFAMNHRMGKVKEVDKFDGSFFGILNQFEDKIDPQSRILLETTYEAIVDSGINPQTIRGSDTGVYIGYSSFGMPEGVPEEVQVDVQSSMTDTLLWLQGQAKCLYANRISFSFDLQGPSIVIDTACSSSLVAFDIAMNDLRLGKCRQAIVGGTQLCLQPFANQIFQSTRLNSEDGIPKVWDERANGFVRGETVCCFLLQRKSDAKRIYATVLNSGVNIDGNKRMGMFFPSFSKQEELMKRVCKEANINPLNLSYFEAHATGTKVGDPQEAKAIYNAYCTHRGEDNPLAIGLLKSCMGHAEGASGVSSLTKVILAYENECIPRNLNLNDLKNTIKPFCPPMVPIMENYKYCPGIAGINNFGVGGVNAHILLEPNYKTFSENNENIADIIPRIVNICGRTEDAFNKLCQWIEDNPLKVTRDFLALLAQTMRIEPVINSSGMPYRGSIVIKRLTDNSFEYKKQYSLCALKTRRPLWFVFPGLGGQWVGMAKALMPIKIFADKIEECHQILKPYGIDLKHLLLSDDKNSMSSMTNKFCATTAIEIALFDVMTALNIIPDGIIGHSFGEIAAAYADGCLTTIEAILVTYYRGIVTESDKSIPKGLMAALGMSWTEAMKICPKGVSVVCNNGKDTVVVSGLYNETKKMVEELSKKGVFVRELQSSDIPYHSEYLSNSAPQLTEVLKKCVPNPILRTNKWLSTALLDSDFDESLRYASAEYFVHNLISPVYFYNKIKHLPLDAIVVEVGPHSLFSKSVKETLDSVDYISLMKKDSNDTNLDMFLGSVAKLYELGLNPIIEKLYPQVEWPVVRGTQSISSLIEWDHSNNLQTRKYPDHYFRASASDMNTAIDLRQTYDLDFADHCIDGNILYPATGYLMLAWRRMASTYAKRWNEVPVVFEDVQFRRPIFLSESDITKIKVRYHEQTGDFSIIESGNITCVGKIKTTDEYCLSVQHLIIEDNLQKDKEFEVVLTANDIYKDLKIMGYDYGPKFRKLQSMKTNDFETLHGEIGWDGNWVTFMDSMLQIMALALPFRKMMVPVMIRSLRCDPKTLYEALNANKFNEMNPEMDFNQRLENLEKESHDVEGSDDINNIIENQNLNLINDLVNKQYHFYQSVLPYYVDMSTRTIVTYGVEIEDLMAFPIPIKNNIQDLKLESYEFIANQDMNAIEESQRKSILEYIKVCSSMVNKIKEKIGIKDNKSEVNVSEELMNKYLNTIKDEHILLKVLNEWLKGCVDENLNVDTNQMIEILDKPENDLSLDVINKVSNNEHLIRSLLDIISECYIPKKEIKVVEINQTNGLMAIDVDNYLASSHIYPIDVNYTIVLNSIETISEELKKRSFKLNEWKASDSSVFPSDISSVDVIVFKDTYDLWSLNVEKHLQQTYDSLVEKGFLLSVFRYQLTEPELTLNQMNGKRNLKNSDLEKRITDYLTAAKSLGFSLICHKSDTIGSMGFLFRKVSLNTDLPKKENIIEINCNSIEWFNSIKEKLNDLKESKESLWFIANDSSINGIIGFINCLRLEPGGEAIKCLFDFDHLIDFPINFKEKPFNDILINDLPINVLKNGKLGTYRHLTLPKGYDLKESDEYFLNIGQSGDISGLRWFDLKNLVSPKNYFSLNNLSLKPIHCNIYWAGLNFRDVMLSTGRIASGPQSLFTDCLIGFEFSGRRTDTGERVMGFDMSRCFATSITVREDYITTIPDVWSMDEAVTVLSTYSTVWYGLIERAHMKQNEKILIHSGAGGVGQAAINICQYYNCDIFVTIGNEDKKKFLMEKFNIPENRIFSSRDIQFKYKIKELTKGKGVDIVLNSLTGDKLDASYECVADCGRFVEIGKYDLQMNKQLGMFSFLRDISFIGVSVDQQLYQKEGFTKRFFDWIHENSNNGMIRPITRNLFRAEEAEKAFRYMTTGKHIGKNLIRIRSEENQRIIKNSLNANKMMVTTKTYFNPNKVYIITGGLGGFGLELVHWMKSLGARLFVLTSRHGVKSDYQKFILNRLKSIGSKFKVFDSKIIVSTHDTNTIDGTKALIEESMKLGPIGGVFHLALVLNDCLLENQTIDKFNETIDSKSKVFESLDKITRNMKLDLDYFVVFSSVTCGKGNAGQTNYGYANSICERICEARHRDGLKGLAIQWGPIGDVGVLADTEMNSSLVSIVKQRINSCLQTMDKLLELEKPIVSCVVRAKRTVLLGSKEAKLVQQLWKALNIDPKNTPNHLTLGEIGMESMFAVELQQGLEKEYGIKVTLNDIKNVTIGMMKDFEAGKVDEMKQFADEIKLCRSKLSKVKFIIPDETHCTLNNVKIGKPVYFLPPLEGIFSSLEELTEKLKRPVIGLNWIRNMDKMCSLKEISEYYIDLMKTLEPKGNYDIIGYSYGALIAMKMMKNSSIGRVVIIDLLSDIALTDDLKTDEFLMDTVLEFIAKDIPSVVRAKLKRDIQSKSDIDSKMLKLSEELKEFGGKSLVSKDMDEIFKNSFKRAKMFTNYRLNMKTKFNKVKYNLGKKVFQMSGKLFIIKPFEMKESEQNIIEKIRSAYFLSEKGIDQNVNYEILENSVDTSEINTLFISFSTAINNFLS